MPQPPGGPGRRPAPFRCLPSGNRADELCALVARPGDARVADQLPPPPVRRGDLPSVVGTARVPEGRTFAEGFRDHLRGPLAGDVVHLDLDAEGLGFHGGLLSPGGGFSRPARLCLLGGFPPGAYIHHSAGPKSQRFFLRKRRPRFLIHARRGRKKPRFFFRRAVFAARAGTPTRRPEPPPGTLSDFALRKSDGRHTSPLCSGKVHPGTGFFDFALVKSGRAALLRFAVKKSGGRHTSLLCSGEVAGQVGVPSRRAEVCPGGGGQIPGCAWRRPRPPHA